MGIVEPSFRTIKAAFGIKINFKIFTIYILFSMIGITLKAKLSDKYGE
jgi:hypothetical protein